MQFGDNFYHNAKTGKLHMHFDRDAFPPSKSDVERGVICRHVNTNWDGKTTIIGHPDDVRAYRDLCAKQERERLMGDVRWIPAQAYGVPMDCIGLDQDGLAIIQQGARKIIIGTDLADAAKRTKTQDADKIRAAL